MVNKRKKRYVLMCVMICLAIMVASVATTLAVLRDTHSSSDDIVFHKVAIAGESETGSSLHIELDNNMVSNGSEIINTEKTGEGYLKNLYFKQATDSADMFVRFRAYFSFGDPKTDLKSEESYILSLLNKNKGVPKGFVPYEDLTYEYVLYGDWYYLVSVDDTIENAEDKILKAVTQEQNTFTICNNYVLSYPSSNEGEILKCVQKNEGIELKVEVQAIQCEGLGNILQDVIEETQGKNDVLISEESADIPKVKVKAFETAYIETREATVSKLNINFDSNIEGLQNYLISNAIIEEGTEVTCVGSMETLTIYEDEWFELPKGSYSYTDAGSKVYGANGWLTEDGTKLSLNTNFDRLEKYAENGELTLKANWEEIAVLKVESTKATILFRRPVNATLLGSTYKRANVYSIDFVGDENFVAGSSYEAIDVGTIAGEITMYVKTRPDTYLDVIIHQEGGVRLNPNSYALFAVLGSTAPMTEMKMNLFDIDSSLVTDVSYMFSGTGNKALSKLDLSGKLDMSNVTTMSRMFYSFNATDKVLVELNLGDNFDTSNVTNMNQMFYQCGYNSLKTLSLGDKFNTENVTDMSQMFYRCGYRSLQTLSLGSEFNTQNVTDMDQMFYQCGYDSMELLDFGNFMVDNFDSEGNLINESNPSSYSYIVSSAGKIGCRIKVANKIVGNWILNQENTFYYSPTNETGKAYLNITSHERESGSAFLGSTEVNENFTRNKISTITFKDSNKINIEEIINGRTYDVVNVGYLGTDISDKIKAYWIESTTSTGYYDVYILQEGGVILNPNSSYLFTYVGYSAMKKLDMGDWDIDTSLVENMSYMFYYCGYTSMEEFRLSNNFNTNKVTNMNYMFNSCGNKKCVIMSLGSMMEDMINEDGTLKEKGVLTSTTRMFEYFGYAKGEIITKNTAVQNWVKTFSVSNYVSIQNLTGKAYLMYCGYETLSPVNNNYEYCDMFRSYTVSDELYRTRIRSMTLKDSDQFDISSIINGKQEGVDYYVVNCGFVGDRITNDIKTYWIEYSYTSDTGYKQTCYDVYIIQKGGVVLNPNSSYLFANILRYHATKLDTTNWNIDTSLATNMSHMFSGSSYEINVKSITIAGDFYTSHVTDMSYMFYDLGITAATKFEFGSCFDTSSVTNMTSMFASMETGKLQYINFGPTFMVNNFNEDGTLTHEINTEGIFSNMTPGLEIQCANENVKNWAKSLDNEFRWEWIPNETGKAYLVDTIFEESYRYNNYTFLGSMKVSDKLARRYIDYIYFVDVDTTINSLIRNKTQNTDYYVVNCGYLGTEITDDIKAYWIKNSNGSSSYPRYDVYIYQEGGVVFNPNSSNLFSGISFRNGLNTTNWKIDTSLVTNMSNMFYGSDLSSAIFASNFDTSNVTDMSYMFRAASVNNLNFVNQLNTSSVTNMEGMLHGVSIRNTDQEVTINIDTSNVTDMSYMFYNIGDYWSEGTIKTMAFGDKFNTSNVKDMSYMFSSFGYKTMTTLDLSTLDTTNVVNATHMFYQCGYDDLTSFIVGDKFNTSNMEDMSYMFYCFAYTSLTSLDLGVNFSTDNAKKITGIFRSCGYDSMISLKLGNFMVNNLDGSGIMLETSLIEEFRDAFDDCGRSTCIVTVGSISVETWIITNKNNLGSCNWMTGSKIIQP